MKARGPSRPKDLKLGLSWAERESPRKDGGGGELLQQLDPLEEQVGGSVRSCGAQLHQDASIVGEMESVLGERRPQQAATQLLDTLAVLPPTATLACREQPRDPTLMIVRHQARLSGEAES